MSRKLKPLVGVVCDVRVVPPHPFHMAGEKYLTALAAASQVAPVLIPGLEEWVDIRDWLDHLDGLFLPGGYSMVHPQYYSTEPTTAETHDYDLVRDSLSLTIIKEALHRDLPLFGVCRGFQEINVAMDGTLHQLVHQVEGLSDHREDKSLGLAEQYAASHSVQLVEGGLLHQILQVPEILVNSLHTQGVDALGRSLAVEATAADGLIEAFRVEGATFGLGVQWHPEWQVMKHPQQRQLFEAFGDACRA